MSRAPLVKGASVKSRATAIVGMASLVVALVSVPLPAQAATCRADLGGGFVVDCTVPDSTSCQTNPDHTRRSVWIPDVGLLELRHDVGCDSHWARSPVTVTIGNLWTSRSVCATGNTSGLSQGGNNSTHRWSRQLFGGGNCVNYAHAFVGDTGYQTAGY